MMQNSDKGSGPWKNKTTGQPHVHPKWRWLSDRGLLVATGEATLAYYVALGAQHFAEIEDIIPADDSVLLVLRRGAEPSTDLRAALRAPALTTQAPTGTLHEIPVEYGGEAGPDLPALAERAGMNPAAYINSHSAADYTVAFLGFQPGFPYLRGLPRALHAPRRSSPRGRVAPGSVAVGGPYTGIYPAGGAGGWQIIGRTPSVLFDPCRAAPALLAPGDRVRFVPR